MTGQQQKGSLWCEGPVPMGTIPMKGTTMYPPNIERSLQMLEGKEGEAARRRRAQLRRMRLKWQMDLQKELMRRSGTARKNDAERHLRRRFRTRAELKSIINRHIEELETGRGTRDRYFDLVAVKSAAEGLFQWQSQARAIFEGGRLFTEFCLQSTEVGFYSSRKSETLRKAIERSLKKFAGLEDAGFREWIAEAVAREAFYEVRLEEIDRVTSLPDPMVHGLVITAFEAMDALMGATTKARLELAASSLERYRRVAEDRHERARKRRMHAVQAEKLRGKVRNVCLLQCCIDRFEKERGEQEAVCRAFIAWRLLQKDMGNDRAWERLRLNLEPLPLYATTWPLGDEITAARMRLAQEAEDVEIAIVG